ncbi:MAG: hypothetical protein MJ252_04280 [archaeon]|nr:hypothetical protein [archaeon]
MDKEKKKEDEYSWKLSNVLKSVTTDTQEFVINYNPLLEKDSPFILEIDSTKKTAYVLMKNGVVIKLVPDSEQNIEKIEELFQLKAIPNEIKFPSKIVNIVCGQSHTLAIGKDDRVYSWGLNTYGQLGVGKTIEEVPEPVEISKLTVGPGGDPNRKIIHIYAVNENSFVIDKANNIYGFGRVKIFF